MQKVALVTGASRGIGLAIADKLLGDGYKVIGTARGESYSGSADYVKCDISKAEDRLSVLEYIKNKYGRIDLLVNNAGVACIERKDILETTEESFDRLISINTKGTFFMCQTFANYMITLRKEMPDYIPRIVNVSSVSSYASSVNRGEYCISKAGISMTTMLFADRLAEYGIPVFEIRPGIIRTSMTESVTEKYDKLIAGGITPVKRWGRPEDVADCVSAAASGLLDFGTGTVLNADGGFNIRRL